MKEKKTEKNEERMKYGEKRFSDGPTRETVNQDTYVGKKLTKLSPKSCAHVIIMKSSTLTSFIAILNPDHALEKRNKNKARELSRKQKEKARKDSRVPSAVAVCFTCFLREARLCKTRFGGGKPLRVVWLYVRHLRSG